MPTTSKDADSQLKLAPKEVNVVDPKNETNFDSVDVLCGWATEFICWSPHIYKEVGGRGFSNWLWELLTSRVFCQLDAIIAVYDKDINNKFQRSIL